MIQSRVIDQVTRAAGRSVRFSTGSLLLRRASKVTSSTSTIPTGCRRFSSSRTDPFARRPTAKCDPYGQGGKPLTMIEAQNLLPTVDPEWKILETEAGNDGDKAKMDQNNDNSDTTIPFAIVRDFWHKDYMQGAQFMTHVSAVAQMNDHFPHQVILDRYLSSREKAWNVRTRIVCRTLVLQGLSHHDFFLATLLDVETKRPEIESLLLRSK